MVTMVRVALVGSIVTVVCVALVASIMSVTRMLPVLIHVMMTVPVTITPQTVVRVVATLAVVTSGTAVGVLPHLVTANGAPILGASVLPPTHLVTGTHAAVPHA